LVGRLWYLDLFIFEWEVDPKYVVKRRAVDRTGVANKF